MLCHDQPVPDFGPMQLVPDSGLMQGTSSQSVPNFGPLQFPEFGLMQRARPWLVPDFGPMQFPDFGPMQWARPSTCLYVIVWYVVVWGSSLSFMLTVSVFGFRYFRE